MQITKLAPIALAALLLAPAALAQSRIPARELSGPHAALKQPTPLPRRTGNQTQQQPGNADQMLQLQTQQREQKRQRAYQNLSNMMKQENDTAKGIIKHVKP